MFIDSDFDPMKIRPIDGLTGYKETFKEISSIINFIDENKQKHSSYRTNAVNYILLMYDPGSPFVKRFHNFEKRMSAVLDYIGIKKDTELYNEIVNYTHDFVSIIDGFIKWINNRVWNMITVNESVFYEYQRELMNSVGNSNSKDKLAALNTKQKILENMDSISARLDGYYSQLYMGDTNIKKSIETRGITPERVAGGVIYAEG